ncbi:O-antigen translocase [Pedobacter sp. KBW01]|uniref:O-antigen translocase n=1 Tax=Pedobacter sp. KBW01 TaxID=2153364 RepID=UPI000F59A33C|nr:O-antigen translocase [Pedobacter sp. KBW01]RQO65697.1 O-antigen translocase [Pedobacter sp. KBW01]
MKLIKTSFFSAIITFIRISSGFVAGKIVAAITGPAGVALIGGFTNFIAVILTFANGAINSGIVKYTAEFNNNELKIKELFSTSLRISVVCSAVFGFILIIFAPYLAEWVLSNSIFTNPIRVLGITAILYSLNTLLISILNGMRQIKTFTIVNTSGTIIGLALTIILVYYYKLQGALYSLVLAQSIVFFLTVALLYKSPWFSWSFFKSPFNKDLGKKLAGYSLMSIVSAVTIPVSQIILRNLLIAHIGINEAGYWQGMMRISDGYLLLVTSSLTTYYLPKLSSLKTNAELRSEIFNGYKIILPVVFVGCIIIYILRFFIIKTLYTTAFLEMEHLFLWQLIGDFFKIATFLLGYLMVAKAMIKHYIATEIIFSTTYVIFGYIFINHFKLTGITIAFAINYFVCFIFMIFVFKKILFRKKG